MAGGYYRVSSENVIEPQLRAPTEIYINKDFIGNNRDSWIELSTIQSGSCSSEMYNNSTQYPNSGYPNTYPPYQQGYNTSYGYQDYGYQTAQPAPPGENYPHNNWNSSGYALPPKETKSEAVVQEMQQQKAQLVKQREDYVRKASVLRHELEQLRNQKQDLLSDGSSDRDLAKILKENDKLQDEIQGKMKAIYNVIEMLSSIIKDNKKVADLEAELLVEQQPSPVTPGKDIARKSPSPDRDRGHDNRAKDKKVEEHEEKPKEKRFNYIYYDSGMHWCRSCDNFPETAKGLLLHLQSKEHQDTAKENEVDTTPWHKLPMEPMNPSYEDAPKKRVPIKGLQFFISAPSWYCKLCDVWIGDLHCASHHLKSQAHFQNYENFTEQNPHWEMEWLKDREKARIRSGKNESSDSDGTSNKKKKRKSNKSLESVMKEKKKKKRSKRKRKHSTESSSSSSSSDSSSDENNDRSKSIRVAMRNMSRVQSIMNEDMSKWNVLERLLEDHRRKEKDLKDKAAAEKLASGEPEDELINQWMTISEPPDKERVLMDSLKDRMKAKQELEKARYAELERRRKEKEREEQEMLERKQREVREKQEELERERKRRDLEEYQRIVDKDRNQVKFKAAREFVTRDNYRRRRSLSKSDVEEDDRYENHHKRGESPRSSRHRRQSERSDHSNSKSEARSRSRDRDHDKREEPPIKKKPPGPPSYKKLPFIGRMPLFKNKKVEEKPPEKELQKEEYEPQRRTRFEPGTLPRAFMPQPDVVCFPKLSSIPPLSAPMAAPSVTVPTPAAPAPPKISTPKQPTAPPPPKIRPDHKKVNNLEVNEDNLYSEHGPEMDPNIMGQYYQGYSNMMYSQMYDFPSQEADSTPHDIPLSHTMPLEPPPLPPDDDLALLGICADDMAAQSF